MKIKKLKHGTSDFPHILKEIPDPPKELYVLGNLRPLLERPRLAVVGSRKVSIYGRNITGQLVREVASRGVVIVSGLALGVDSLAHQAALEAGSGTIAVMPCGLDKIYPSSHRFLAKRILEEGGALISEYAEGTPPLQHHFIARNRLVSGLSDGVLITEAAEKSGTLHTANFALEQGKTVMAAPGNISNPMSKGTNNLLKAGATMVTETADILFALGLAETEPRQTEIFGATAEETYILEQIASGNTDAALILHASTMDASQFNQTLTMLEINGRIRPLGAGHWSLK